MSLPGTYGLVDRQFEKGILDHFAQRGVNPVLAPGEIGDPLPVGNRLDQWGNEQRGLVAEDVRPQERAGFGVGVELAETAVVLNGPRTRGLTVILGGFYELSTFRGPGIGRRPRRSADG
jgi:hypothetical protein